MILLKKVLLKKLEKDIEEEETVINKMIQKRKKKWNPEIDFLFYLNIAIFFLSLLINFDKPSFICLILSIIYQMWWILKDNNHILFKY